MLKDRKWNSCLKFWEDGRKMRERERERERKRGAKKKKL